MSAPSTAAKVEASSATAYSDRDLVFLREAIRLAGKAREHGNHPFGALLVMNETGNVLDWAENTVNTESDCTGHAETNLVRKASKSFPPNVLSGCTLYTSTEPCCMCAGAIHWGEIGRVVYGLSEATLYDRIGGNHASNETLKMPCRTVFSCSDRPVQVVGPLLEEEAWKVHEGFW